MENLIDAVKSFRERRQQPSKSSLESLKAAYTQILQKEKELETFLDDTSVPIEKRQAKIEEFKGILRQLNQFLTDIVHAGHYLKREEVRNGFCE